MTTERASEPISRMSEQLARNADPDTEAGYGGAKRFASHLSVVLVVIGLGYVLSSLRQPIWQGGATEQTTGIKTTESSQASVDDLMRRLASQETTIELLKRELTKTTQDLLDLRKPIAKQEVSLALPLEQPQRLPPEIASANEWLVSLQGPKLQTRLAGAARDFQGGSGPWSALRVFTFTPAAPDFDFAYAAVKNDKVSQVLLTGRKLWSTTYPGGIYEQRAALSAACRNRTNTLNAEFARRFGRLPVQTKLPDNGRLSLLSAHAGAGSRPSENLTYWSINTSAVDVLVVEHSVEEPGIGSIRSCRVDVWLSALEGGTQVVPR
jgi:hypothetical protein